MEEGMVYLWTAQKDLRDSIDRLSSGSDNMSGLSYDPSLSVIWQFWYRDMP